MADAEDKKTGPEPETREPVGPEPIAHESLPAKIDSQDSERGGDFLMARESVAQENLAPVKEASAGSSAKTVLADAASIFVKKPDLVRAAYEHPFAIRLTHWVNAVSVFVLVTSGLRIFRAFPSFGPKIPEEDLIDIPKALTLGGWLGGALQWHFTFMWLFATSGVIYLGYQFLSGHYRTVLFKPKDIPRVWPMVRHYFLFGPKPPVTDQYNPLQKLAYTSTVGFGVLSFLTGLVLYKPLQFS